MSYSVVQCDSVRLADLAGAMNAAFSDYLVPMQMDEAAFGAMLRQRGFNPHFSHVAVSGQGAIAAFWLAGAPSWAYGNVAYTISTGTLPDHRRKGLLKQLFASVRNQLAKAGAKTIQLEAITGNKRAVDAYLGLGFVPRRKLLLIRAGKSGIVRGGNDAIRIAPAAAVDLPKDTGDYFTSLPTPQNSRAALVAARGKISVLGAYRRAALAGWGAVDPIAGSVAQIAVHKTYRRQGIGTSLLNAIAEETGQASLVFVNIDQDDPGLLAFVEAHGGVSFLSQHEMVYDL